MPLHTHRSFLRLGSLLAAVAVAGGCNDSTTLSDRCFLVVVSVSPPAPSLAVSDTVYLAASYNGAAAECRGPVPASALVWRSSDATVATVDSVSGLVTAIGAGNAQVSAFDPGGAHVLGFARIAVSGP